MTADARHAARPAQSRRRRTRRHLLAAARRIAHYHALTALLADIDKLTMTPAAVTTLPDGLMPANSPSSS